LHHKTIKNLEIMTTNVITSGASSQDFEMIDQIINLETKRKANKVEDANDFGILTACYIDGEFVLVTNYPLPEGMDILLQNA
jgi:hypothetical protein